ncbi:MAG: tetratricopeptide repeat protein, partial [Planctomycetota bacterium]
MFFRRLLFQIKTTFGRAFAGLGRPLRIVTAVPSRWISNAWRGFIEFWPQRQNGYHRTLRRFLGALPAALTGVAVTAFLILGYERRSSLADVYERAAVSATKDGETEAAVLYRQRLGQMGRTGQADRFQLAAAMSEDGRVAEASEIVTGLLGNEDEPGYAPAHVLAARQLLEVVGAAQEGEKDADPQDVAVLRRNGEAARRTALRHLAYARRADPDNIAVTGQVAALLLQAGRPDRAVPLLEEVAPDRPELWVDLMRLKAAMGLEEEAKEAAREATPVLVAELRRDPLDDRTRVQLTDALARLGRFNEAVQTLEDGRELHPDKDFAQLLAALHVSEYGRSVRDKDQRLGRRLALLRRALNYKPSFAPALVQLANFGQPVGDGSDGDANRAAAAKLLNELLATGDAPAGAHFALGMNKLQSGNTDAAIFHFEQAHALDPKLSAASNNLAFLLLSGNPPDLPRALELSNSAVATAPQQPNFRHTRGAILAAMDRPREALTEYELAMAGGMKDNPEVRAQVADLYDTLGQPDLAKAFRKGLPQPEAPADQGDAGSTESDDGLADDEKPPEQTEAKKDEQKEPVNEEKPAEEPKEQE